MNTLLLDRTQWDLVLDANGDMAMASNPYAIAQDVASACRLFLGELWYDNTSGVPYWQRILGLMPPLSLVKSALAAAALTVPQVVQARCLIASFTGRVVTGQVQVIDTTGASHNVTF
ncbi:MAG: hypothetical protein LBH10_06415 [Burkholderiaceae bacterium]|jgi:hypothetical protein|nr:hypothetical protein [Burkholderiaceae bacterium]